MLRAYGDGNLFGEPYGEGPVRVLWLHGWQRRGQDFRAAATELAGDGVASVALDLPGFGASPPPLVAGGARMYADLIAPAVAALADEPLVIVGHSLGGRVATVLGAQYPELVRALVLVAAPLVCMAEAKKAPWRYRLERFLGARGMVSPARVDAARQRYGSADYRNATGLIRDVLVAMVNESYEDELARLVVPVSLLWGERDAEVPVAVAQRALELIGSDHSLTVIAGIGHLVPLETPEELRAAVRRALA